jgi:hypothetical protein
LVPSQDLRKLQIMQNPCWCWCFTCLGFASLAKPDQWKCLKPYSSLSRKRLPRGKHEQREREREREREQQQEEMQEEQDQPTFLQELKPH